MSDLFPGVHVPVSNTGSLLEMMREQIQIKALQPHPGFIEKIIQLYETMNVRFGVAVVGPTGGGKTEMHTILKNTLTALREADDANESYQKVTAHILNPKCITMGELYGEFNALTQEWTDGLASTLIREAVADESNEYKWTIFDGPVDALWIENMNTVLDDNMTLCLANGERIKLRSQMKMLFEVQDLEVASPATVSRLGVMYVDSAIIGWFPYVKSWLTSLVKGKVLSPKDSTQKVKISLEVSKRFLELFELNIKPTLKFIREECAEAIQTVNLNLVTSLCNILEGLLSMYQETISEGDAIIDKLFAYAFIWSIGASQKER